MVEHANINQKDLYNKSEIEWHQQLLNDYSIEADKIMNTEPFDIKQYNYYIRQMITHAAKICELLKR